MPRPMTPMMMIPMITMAVIQMLILVLVALVATLLTIVLKVDSEIGMMVEVIVLEQQQTQIQEVIA